MFLCCNKSIITRICVIIVTVKIILFRVKLRQVWVGYPEYIASILRVKSYWGDDMLAFVKAEQRVVLHLS